MCFSNWLWEEFDLSNFTVSCQAVASFFFLLESYVVVVSPLVSLIEKQICSSRKFNLSPSIDANKFTEISEGKFNILFGTPESLAFKEVEREMLSLFFDQNLICIVVDEVHLVTWYVCNFICSSLSVFFYCCTQNSIFSIDIVC